ncbi:MAG: hypothetical protein KAT91_03140 [Candidatus Aenigmarchaeota archaeon]|nr:hypothetical protein [Candidatus Aenigmarchaeota archaeon]
MVAAKKEKKIEYKDELLSGQDVIVIKFKGNDPFGKICKSIEGIVRQTLEIDAPKFFEKYIGWDLTDGTFKGRWEARKPGDRWTKMYISVWCWGEQSLKDKNGWMNLKINATIDTKLWYHHSIQKSLWWTYAYAFYNRHRRKMWEEYRDYLFEVEERIREELGISRKSPTQAHAAG